MSAHWGDDARPPGRGAARACRPWRTRRRAGRDLTYIDQKRLELARALASDPRLLLLDEWLAGLNPSELKLGIELIQRTARRRAHHHSWSSTSWTPSARFATAASSCRAASRSPTATSTTCFRARSRPRLSGRWTMLERRKSHRRLWHAPRAGRTCTVDVAPGEICVILGANGAGKTHAAEGDRRHGQPGARRADHHRRARHHSAKAARDRRGRHRAGAGGQRHLRRSDRCREPATRRLWPPGARGTRAGNTPRS